MAELQNFRSAFNGFNREDVVHYIEYLNNRHNAQVAQLNADLQALQEQLQSQPSVDAEAAAQLEEAHAKCAELEAEVASLREQLELANQPRPNEELEAYRRAERAERTANERVAQLYHQANGTLAEATNKVDDAATQITELADQVCAQLLQLQSAVTDGKSAVRSAAAAMYAIRPISEK